MSEEREHLTDGKPCWCGPLAQREGEAIIWIHRQLPPCPICAELGSLLESERGKHRVTAFELDGQTIEANRLRSELSAAKAVIEAARKCEPILASMAMGREARDEWTKLWNALSSLPPSPSDSTHGGGL